MVYFTICTDVCCFWCVFPSSATKRKCAEYLSFTTYCMFYAIKVLIMYEFQDSSFSYIVLFPKTLTMQTGELNFDDIFTEENLQRKYFFIVPASIVLTVFIIVMVILFPILLTGLTVDSIAVSLRFVWLKN